MRRVRLTLALCLGCLALGASAEPEWSDRVLARVGELDFRECRLEGERRWRHLQCARLSVPETGSESDSIELLIVRLPAAGARVAEDPLLAIAGGPGQAASESFLWLDRSLADLNQRRSLYLVDQRGTGHSRPQHCALDGLADKWLGGEATDYAALAERCLEHFRGDPARYTTEQAVADLERVRRALGLAQWNLYGVSYGTRVAQHYMRTHPGAVRSAVLDGVLPLDRAVGTHLALNSQAALEALLTRCERSAPCARAHPELEQQLNSLFRRLESGPVQVRYRDPHSGERERLAFTRTRLAVLIRLALYRDRLQALLPPMLARAARDGDFGPLARLSRRLDPADRLALGMHNSVVCAEDVPFYPDQPEPGSADTYLGTQVFEGLRELCRHWPVPPAPASFKQPLESDIPTLLLSGELDPITPPAFAEQVARGLSRSLHRVAPGRAHHVGTQGCAPRLIAQFVEAGDPEALAGEECLERLSPTPLWLDFNGPGP